MALVQESKNERLNTLLEKTNELLESLGEKILQQQELAKLGEEALRAEQENEEGGGGEAGEAGEESGPPRSQTATPTGAATSEGGGAGAAEDGEEAEEATAEKKCVSLHTTPPFAPTHPTNPPLGTAFRAVPAHCAHGLAAQRRVRAHH